MDKFVHSSIKALGLGLLLVLLSVTVRSANAAGPVITAIDAANHHTCALTDSGAVRCWGSNGSGEVGDGTSYNNREQPTAVVGLQSGVTAIATGISHSCALTEAGGVKCWGWNYFGQLGDGTTTSRSVPVDVQGLTSGVSAIAAGGDSTCAALTAGGVKCWGSNLVGGLGDGTATNRHAPVDVQGLPDSVSRLALGGAHTCALLAAGGVKCWGANGFGQLGDGSRYDRLAPVAVQGLASGVTAITAGSSYTCALTDAGTVKCWGTNGYGILGINNMDVLMSTTPIDVVNLQGVTAIDAHREYTCALTVAGVVKCWGRNLHGGLGNNTTTDSPLPVDVQGLAPGASVITAGSYHSCAALSQGGAQCWGINDYGELGNRSRAESLVPVDVYWPNTPPTDQTPPTVTITGVTQGASYPLGSVPTAGCSTMDDESGVATEATVSVTGGTANGVGAFTATCSGAVDNEGNTADPVSVNYSVIYPTADFTWPVSDERAVNGVKAGAALPVEFSLGGDRGLSIFAQDYPVSQQIACDSNEDQGDVTETVTAGQSGLTYDAASDTYTYVWKTDKGWANSCRSMTIRLDDGTDHTAYFMFKP